MLHVLEIREHAVAALLRAFLSACFGAHQPFFSDNNNNNNNNSNGSGGNDPSKRLAQLPVGSWPYFIWNCGIYIWIQLQLGKLQTYAVRLNRKLDKERLGSRLYATRRIQRTIACLWAMKGSERKMCFFGGGVQPLSRGGTRQAASVPSLLRGCVCAVSIQGAEGPLTPQTQTRPNRLHTHTHPPKRLAHPRSPIPPLSTLTSRATHAHPTSSRSNGFCAIWGCITSSSTGGSFKEPSV